MIQPSLPFQGSAGKDGRPGEQGAQGIQGLPGLQGAPGQAGQPVSISLKLIPAGQNGRHFANDIFRCIFVNEKFDILNKISLKFVP